MKAVEILSAGISAAYNVDIAKKYGINEAIVLNKLVFLHQLNKRADGFTWYTTKDWEEHTALSYYQVRKALEHLADEGIIEIKNTYIQGTTTKAKHHRFILETSQSGTEVSSLPIGSLETPQSGTEVSSLPIGSLETPQSGTEVSSLPIYNNANSIEHSNKVKSNSAELDRFHDFVCNLFEKDKTRFKLTTLRKQKLKLRLKELGEKRLRQAFINIANSAFHRGDNARGWKVDDDPYWVTSSAEKAEKWANMTNTQKDFGDRQVSIAELRERGLI